MAFNAKFFFSVTTVCIITTLSGLCNMENSQYILRNLKSRANDLVYGQISNRNDAIGTSNRIIKESMTTNGKENVYNCVKVLFGGTDVSNISLMRLVQNENQTNNVTRHSIKDSKGFVEKDETTKVISKRNITRINNYPHLVPEAAHTIHCNEHISTPVGIQMIVVPYVNVVQEQMRILIYSGDISF